MQHQIDQEELQRQQQRQQQRRQPRQQQQQNERAGVNNENVAGQRDETPSGGDVRNLPGTSRGGARNSDASGMPEALDTGHPSTRKRRSLEENEQTAKKRVSFKFTDSEPSTEPTLEIQGTVPAPMVEQGGGGGGGGVEPVSSAVAIGSNNTIEKLSATTLLALKEWIQRKGADYECSFEDLSSDVQQSIEIVHRDDEACLRNSKEKVDTCLNVMIGLGLIRRMVDSEAVVVGGSQKI